MRSRLLKGVIWGIIKGLGWGRHACSLCTDGLKNKHKQHNEHDNSNNSPNGAIAR